MFYLVHAYPVGGYREHKFVNAEHLADHVQHNRPGWFAGVPEVNDDYDVKMAELRRHPYRMPDLKK